MKPRGGLRAIQILLALLIMSYGLIGCGPKRDQNENTVLLAYRLIDENRTDEAIALLEKELSKDPKNTDYTLVLASAYAHKSGIKIQKLVPLFAHADTLKNLKQKWTSAKRGSAHSERINIFAANVARLFGQASAVMATYSAIPTIVPKNAVYLEHAIYLLNSLGDKLKQEDVVYRMVLEVILFKHIFAESLVGEFVRPKNMNEKSCSLDLAKINATTVTLGKLLIDIFNDIGFFQPKQAKTMKQLAADTREAISNLTAANTSVMVLDELSNLFLHEMVIQHGFGKIVKCGGG